MTKVINWLFKESEKINSNSLYDKIKNLENRIKVLEEENIQQTNSLYEFYNSLESRIDIIMNEK